MSVHWRLRIAEFLKQEQVDRSTGVRITTVYHREQAGKCGVGLARYLQMRAAETSLRQFAVDFPEVFEASGRGLEGEARTVLEIQKAFKSKQIDKTEFKKRLGDYLSGKLSRHLFQKEQNKKEVIEDAELIAVKEAFRKSLKANSLKWLDGEIPGEMSPFEHVAVCQSRRGIELLGVCFEGIGANGGQHSSFEGAVMRSCLDQGWVVSHSEYGPFVDSDCLGYAAFVGSKVLIRKQPRSIPKNVEMNSFIKRIVGLYRRI